MKRKIWINKVERRKLIERFEVSPSTMSDILNFKRMNEQHSRIRSYAMNELNGTLITL